MSPYRVNYYTSEPKRFNWDRWIFAPLRGLLILTLVVSLFFGIPGLVAWGLQYVVEGFAGHSVGHFWHYYVATFLFTFLCNSWRQSNKG